MPDPIRAKSKEIAALAGSADTATAALLKGVSTSLGDMAGAGRKVHGVLASVVQQLRKSGYPVPPDLAKAADEDPPSITDAGAPENDKPSATDAGEMKKAEDGEKKADEMEKAEGCDPMDKAEDKKADEMEKADGERRDPPDPGYDAMQKGIIDVTEVIKGLRDGNAALLKAVEGLAAKVDSLNSDNMAMRGEIALYAAAQTSMAKANGDRIDALGTLSADLSKGLADISTLVRNTPAPSASAEAERRAASANAAARMQKGAPDVLAAPQEQGAAPEFETKHLSIALAKGVINSANSTHYKRTGLFHTDPATHADLLAKTRAAVAEFRTAFPNNPARV